jgi:radical SAM superfamily enzyme YgiQ (UPF0313 family)
MFGLDHDTKDSFYEVYDFIRKSRIAYPLLNIYTPIPGTPLFDKLKEEGRLDLPDAESFFKANPLYSIPNNRVYFEPKNISRRELSEGFMKLSRRLSTVTEVLRRSLYKPDLLSLQVLKMNLSFRRDCQRLEKNYNVN